MSTAGEFPEALEDWWADYVRSLRRRGHGRSEETVKLHRRSYERFWHWAMTQDETRAPADVTTKTVNAWVDELRTQVAPTTVAIYWRNLRPLFSWWAKEVEVTNPFAGADVPSAKPQDPDVIDLDDIRALLETCKGREFAADPCQSALLCVKRAIGRFPARPRKTASRRYRTRLGGLPRRS